jgi:hypothetical protein
MNVVRKMDAVARRLGIFIRSRTTALPNVCNIVQQFPPSFRQTILQEYGVELTEWAIESGPLRAISLFPLFRESDARIAVLSPACASLVAAVDTREFQAIPLRLAQFDLINEPLAAPVVAAVLTRAHTEPDSSAVQRVIWDLICYSETHRTQAAQVAGEILADGAVRSDMWNFLALCGAVIVAGSPIDRGAIPPIVTPFQVGEVQGKDRFQIARVVLAACELGSREIISTELAAHLRRLVRETTDAAGLSSALLERAMLALA